MARSVQLHKNKPNKSRFGLRRKGFYVTLVFTIEERISKPFAGFVEFWLESLLGTKTPEKNCLKVPMLGQYMDSAEKHLGTLQGDHND